MTAQTELKKLLFKRLVMTVQIKLWQYNPQLLMKPKRAKKMPFTMFNILEMGDI